MLKQFLSHCCQERTYSFSIKKCGQHDCLICSAPRLCEDDFKRLSHLPDPVPTEDGRHYKSFQDVVGTATSEVHLPSLKTKSRKHNVPFNPLQQHALNTRLLLECCECNKPRLLFSKKKLSNTETLNFKKALNGLMYTCGAAIIEFKDQINSRYHKILETVFVKENHTCLVPVESIYYSCKVYQDCCVWCGIKRRLDTAPTSFPICSGCKVSGKKTITKKRSRKEQLPA